MTVGDEAALARAAWHAHAHLDGPLPLETLAQVAGFSPHHFHRRFRDGFGEAPAAYVRRLRLERAAWRLQLHTDSILAIALDCGFRDHATFSRAFRSRYGTSPRAYRQSRRLPARAQRSREEAEIQLDYSLSPTRIRTLQVGTIAFVRHTGPYETVDPGLWSVLDAWAEKRGLPSERALLGIAHDAPGITAPEHLRFDAAVTVPPGTAGEGLIMTAALPSYRCAVATHVGSYATLPDAYPKIFAYALAAAPDLVGLPVIEVYDDQTISLDRKVSRTEIHLPIRQL